MFQLKTYLEQLTDELKRPIEYQMVGTKSSGKLLFGGGIVKSLGEEVKKLKAKEVMLVTDETLKKAGIAPLVQGILEEANLLVKVFSHIEPEPHAKTAEELSSVVKEGSFDCIVGLGGGSVMDMAKMASVMATNDGTVEDYLKGMDIKEDGLPNILLPTTSGTGSEVSPYVVCSIGEQKYYVAKPQFFAHIAMVDPLLTVTMPPKVTAHTGLDALSHAIEGMTSKGATPISEAFGGKATKYVMEYLKRAYRDGEDLEARYYMSWASSLGMLAYVNVGGLYAHSFSYVMTSHKSWTHGLGCGFSLPYTMMYNLDTIEEKLKELALVLGQDPTKGTTSMAKDFISEIQALSVEVGLCKSLKEYGFTQDELNSLAKEMVEQYHRATNPREMKVEDGERLLEAMFEGALDSV